jgi:hypothetical protein
VDRVVDPRPLARGEAQLEAHRLDRQQQIGENDGRVHIQNLDRLQRNGRGQIRPFANFQNANSSSARIRTALGFATLILAMEIINISQAKAHLSDLIERAADGEEIVIGRGESLWSG